MRGISPLVATIMLIAFTLIVAGILAAWATQFAQSQRRQFEICANARLMILRASYDEQNETLSVIVHNYGSASLDLVALLEYTNTTLHPNIIEQYPQTCNVSANSIGSLTLRNVTKDLAKITVNARQ